MRENTGRPGNGQSDYRQTELPPNRHSPEAVARRRRRQRWKRIRFVLFILLLILAIVLAVRCTSRIEEPEESSLSSMEESSESSLSSGITSRPAPDESLPESTENEESGVSGGDVSDESSEEESSDPYAPTDASEDWALMLVNADNPMPEDYTIELGNINERFRMEKRAAEQMIKMIEAAEADGIGLYVTSAYRSVDYQQQLFDTNIQNLMAQGMTREEAEAETARNIAVPGTSEHSIGLAADIVTSDWFYYHTDLTEDFEDTAAFDWLSEHAQEYGFILRYPKDKQDITKITYEPWHYRYVGLSNAEKIKASGLCLEEYVEKYVKGEEESLAE